MMKLKLTGLILFLICSFSVFSSAVPLEFKNVSFKPDRQMTELEQAVMLNDTKKVQDLLAKNVSLNPPNTNQGFPLIYAVYHDNFDTSLALLKKGVKVDDKMSNGLSSIALAVLRNQVTLTMLLLEYGADPKQKLENMSLLEIAEQLGYGEIAFFLRAKLSVEVSKNKKGTKKP